MENLLSGIEKVLLLGPGPSPVPESVYNALGRDTLGHMDPYFIRIMDEIKVLLQEVMQTQNDVTLPLSGTGSAGMEACFVNLVEAGDPVLILINGVFGMRMQDVAARLGAHVDTLEFEWGTPVIPEQVEAALEAKQYKIVALVHAETSTGVRNPAEEIGALLKGRDSLYLLDTVTSLGGIAVNADAWGVDALYSGSQKCLSCPPGLAPVTFSERGMDAVAHRKSKVPNWYLDLNLLTAYWEGKTRVYHHTAPINMLYALYQALTLVVDEGPEHVFQRHLESHLRLVEGLEDLGMRMLVEPAFRLPMLNSAYVPEGVDDAQVRGTLRTEFKIEIGSGLGSLAGKIWRFGLMGHGAREESVDWVLEAVGEILGR